MTEGTDVETCGPRHGGRPRDARADAAIRDAALDLFCEAGFDGMSIEAVAARAGVGKTTIYRRWPSKEALIVAAVGTSVKDAEPPIDTGTLSGDLDAIATRARRSLTGTVSADIFPQILRHVAEGTQLGRLWFEQEITPKRCRMIEMLERAAARGELRSGTDLGGAADAILGTVIFLRLSRRIYEMDDRALAGVLEQLVSGMRRTQTAGTSSAATGAMSTRPASAGPA